jgi:hypothetical protein
VTCLYTQRGVVVISLTFFTVVVALLSFHLVGLLCHFGHSAVLLSTWFESKIQCHFTVVHFI